MWGMFFFLILEFENKIFEDKEHFLDQYCTFWEFSEMELKRYKFLSFRGDCVRVLLNPKPSQNIRS